jgi:hypothetical protein
VVVVVTLPPAVAVVVMRRGREVSTLQCNVVGRAPHADTTIKADVRLIVTRVVCNVEDKQVQGAGGG